MESENFVIEVGADDAGMATGLVGTRHRFSRPGPRVLVTGALHGDEVTATGAIWRLREMLAHAPVAGSLTLIPCVNQLAVRASRRHIPLELSDLNRQFPGRRDGALGERLAAALVELLGEHDALIDVHTAGLSTCFALLDHIADAGLHQRVVRWAEASGLPVIGEMPPELSDAQGIDRSWSSWAVRSGKPAITMELAGFHAIEVEAAVQGAHALMAMLLAAGNAVEGGGTGPARLPALVRSEIHSGAGGLFEVERKPGERAAQGDRLGVVRSLSGEPRFVLTAPQECLILAVQPLSAVSVGSWLATLAVAGG